MTWSNEIATGHTRIDEDHKHLIALVNRLHDAMLKRAGKDQLATLFDELALYTKEHFGREETLMGQIAYAGAAEHRGQHKTLIDQLTQLRTDFGTGKVTITLETMKFLQGWVSDHILKSDRKLAEAAAKAGAKPAAR